MAALESENRRLKAQLEAHEQKKDGRTAKTKTKRDDDDFGKYEKRRTRQSCVLVTTIIAFLLHTLLTSPQAEVCVLERCIICTTLSSLAGIAQFFYTALFHRRSIMVHRINPSTDTEPLPKYAHKYSAMGITIPTDAPPCSRL